MMYNRSSNEIMKEMMHLFAEYTEVKEREDRQQRDRLDHLEMELHHQEDRIHKAAKILLGGE